MNIREELEKRNGNHEAFVFQDVEVKPERIRAVLINEVVPQIRRMTFTAVTGRPIYRRRFRCSRRPEHRQTVRENCLSRAFTLRTQ